MAFDNQKVISLLELVGGPRDKAFFSVAFPEATEAELNEALVALSLEGAIEMHSDGISLTGATPADTTLDFQPLSDEQIASELDDAHARFYTGLGHLPDVPIIGAEPAQASEAETTQPVKPEKEPQVDEGPGVQVDIPDELWAVPIELLNLREPVVRNLNRSHIHSIQDLVSRSEADIMALRGMGLKKVNEVIDALGEIGLSLSMTPLAPDAAFFTTQKRADAMERLVSVEPETLSGPISIDDWLSQLKENQRQAMEQRLEGKKLQQVGDAMGVTRERVRQLQSKALKNHPELEEDEYRYLFDTYDLSENAFCTITGEPARTYYYLRVTSENKNGGKPMHEMLEDEQIPESMKEALRETGADAGAIYVDGERIEKNKHVIAAYLLKGHFDGGPISLEQLYDAHVAFLKQHGLDGEKRLDPTNRRAFYTLLERNSEMLVTTSDESDERGIARTFDTAADFTPLEEVVGRFAERNIECSAAWLIEQAPVTDAAHLLDIRSGTELHTVLSRYCNDIPGIALGRNPVITLGSADRDDQVLDLIKEMSPATPQELGDEYQKRYGVSAATFCGSYLKDFKTYLRGKQYVYDAVRLSPDQVAFVSQEIDRNGGYVSLKYLREQFLQQFPEMDASAINRETVASAGGRVSGNLAIREGVDIGHVFQGLIDSNDYINAYTPGAGPEVLGNLEFQGELNKALRRFAVVEYDDGSYLSTRILAEIPHPVYADDMRDFLDSAIAFMERGVPYTVTSLKKSGFDHRLFQLAEYLPVKDKFYESILAQGYVGGALKRTLVEGTTFFCKKDGWFSIPDVLEYVASQHGDMKVAELQACLRDGYGYDIDRAKLLLLLQRTNLQRDRETDVLSRKVS